MNDTVRFFKRVSPQSSGCWDFTTTTPNGYGYFWLDGRMQYAHRVAYQWLVGPIPDGLDIDHLCRNRACCNPDHVEPVTRQVNIRRSSLTLASAHAENRNCGFDGCKTCRRFRVSA